ncbi:hypothetical protein ATH50_2229 [Haloplanus aerogenes]|nr:hypothetical protein ATH50_2229 [Haloplanus aerogenes]
MYFPTIDYCQFQFPAPVETLEELRTEIAADGVEDELGKITKEIISHELEHTYQNRGSPAWVRLYFPNLLANIVYLNLLKIFTASSKRTIERDQHTGMIRFVLTSLDVELDEFERYENEYSHFDISSLVQLFHFGLQVGVHCHMMISLSMWEPLQEVSARIAEAITAPDETRNVLADHYARLSSNSAENDPPARPSVEEFMEGYEDDMESILEMFRAEWHSYGQEYQRYVLYRILDILDRYGEEHIRAIPEFIQLSSNLSEQGNPSSIFLRLLEQIEVVLARKQSDDFSDRILRWLQKVVWWLIPDFVLYWLINRQFPIDLYSIDTEDAHLDALNDAEQMFHELKKVDPSNPLFELFEAMSENLDAVANSPLPSLVSFTDRGIEPSPTIATRFDETEIYLLKVNAGLTVIRWSAIESILQHQNVMADVEPAIDEFVEDGEVRVLYEQTSRIVDELIAAGATQQILELASRFQSELGFGFFQRSIDIQD